MSPKSRSVVHYKEFVAQKICTSIQEFNARWKTLLSLGTTVTEVFEIHHMKTHENRAS